MLVLGNIAGDPSAQVGMTVVAVGMTVVAVGIT
jgi:hypothetical protein